MDLGVKMPAEPKKAFLISTPPYKGAKNMDYDEAVLNSIGNDPSLCPVFRFFRWIEPTVSYGRLQNSRLARDWADMLGGIKIARRPTGGGMVYHSNDISLSVSWSRKNALFESKPGNIYGQIHGAIKDGINVLGVDAAIYKNANAHVCGDMRCFQSPVEGDLVYNGLKIVGGAIRITKQAVLYQGAITLDSEFSHDRIRKAVVDGFKNKFNVKFTEVEKLPFLFSFNPIPA